MATRGAALGEGYVKELGVVRIFHDLDNPNMFFVQAIKSDATRYLHRSHVTWRRSYRKQI